MVDKKEALCKTADILEKQGWSQSGSYDKEGRMCLLQAAALACNSGYWATVQPEMQQELKKIFHIPKNVAIEQWNDIPHRRRWYHHNISQRRVIKKLRRAGGCK